MNSVELGVWPVLRLLFALRICRIDSAVNFCCKFDVNVNLITLISRRLCWIWQPPGFPTREMNQKAYFVMSYIFSNGS